MISFNGVGLVPPGNADEIVSRWWHRDAIIPFQSGFFTATGGLDHLPMPAQRDHGPPRIGYLTWPVGSSYWGQCHLLATSSQLEAIGIGTTSGVLTLWDGTHAPLNFPMSLLPARPIGQRGQGGDYYLLTFVDERYWWWMAGTARSPHGDENSGIEWSGLLSKLLNGVGASAYLPTVPEGYGQANGERWNVGYKPVCPMIDAAAATIGMRLVRYPDGSLEFQDYTTAQNYDAQLLEQFGSEILSGGVISQADAVRNTPGRVAVEFAGEDGTDLVTVRPANAEAEWVGEGGNPRAAAYIHGDLKKPAECAPPEVLAQYYEDRAAYATQAATDYYGWCQPSTDATIRGLVARPPTGFDLCVEWCHPPDRKLLTRVVRRPWADANIYGDRIRNAYEIIQGDVDGVATDFTKRRRLNFSDAFVVTDDPGCLRTNVDVVRPTLTNTNTPGVPYYPNPYSPPTTTPTGCTGLAVLSSGSSYEARTALGITGPKWVAGLQSTDCLSASAYETSGSCSTITTPQTLTMSWDGSGWTSTGTFSYYGGSGVVRFWVSNGSPHLSINGIELLLGPSGGGNTTGCDAAAGYPGASTRYIDFYGGTGTTTPLCPPNTSQTCGDNTFRVRVTCGCCVALSVSASADPASGTVSLAVLFTVTPNTYTPPLTYVWDFGDGTTSAPTTDTTITHTYDFPGTYNAFVTATDSCGNTSIAYAIVTATSATPTPPTFNACGANTAMPSTGTTCGTAGAHILGTVYDLDSATAPFPDIWAVFAVAPNTTYSLRTVCTAGYWDVSVNSGLTGCSGHVFQFHNLTGTISPPATGTDICTSFTTGPTDNEVSVRLNWTGGGGCLSWSFFEGTC